MLFSDYFKLNLKQKNMDFLDIPVDTDWRFFVDPYAITKEAKNRYPFAMSCHNLIVDYFQALLNLIGNNRKHDALAQLRGIKEPNETHLGYSIGESRGRSVGKKKDIQIYKSLAGSKAVTSGSLKDIEDCDLVIKGISFDNISDITICIIREFLAQFTLDQCRHHGISTSATKRYNIWSTRASGWQIKTLDLPEVVGKNGTTDVILIPKSWIRKKFTYNSRDYYQHWVLTKLQEIDIAKKSSLPNALRTGKIKPITKRELRKLKPPTKDYLFDFSNEHPEVLKNYKKSAGRENNQLSDEYFDALRSEDRNENE